MRWEEFIASFQEIVRALAARLERIELRETPPTSTSTVALLPASSSVTVGRLRLVTNGRKTGEGVGAGTGVLAYNDGVAWRRVSDDSTVLA